MRNFPPVLKHGSGVTMTIVPTRLLLSFRQPRKLEEVEGSVQNFGLVVETGDRGIERASKTRQPQLVVNNTNHRYWVKTKDGREISPEVFDTLEHDLVESLEWVGPVYKVGNAPDLGGLICPLPNVIMVKQVGKRDAGIDREISHVTAAARIEIREVPEKSKYLGGYRYYVIANVRTQNAYQLRSALERTKGIDVRFENMPMIVPTTLAPNDTQFAQQWDMTQIQAGGAGTTGWDLSTGNPAVIVCILDSGCDLTHPDLQFVNQGIDLGTMADDGSPNGGDPNPAAHGTACAGVAAATINNNLGVAGVAGACRILPLAFSNWTDAEVAAGINFAADNGARVVSMSFGVYAPGEGMGPTGWDFTVIDPAIEHAVNDEGCVLCAATGNEDVNTFNRYPSRHPLVIACGASDQVDNRKSSTSPDGETWWGSNFADGVSVVAPGVLIPTTDRQGNLGYNSSSGTAGDFVMNFNGTSSATPHVAGFAALLMSLNPALTNIQVRDIIERTAEKVGTVAYAEQAGFPNGTRNQEMGYGRISVLRGLDFADVMIRDWWGDAGVEPSTPPSGNFWSFSDIVVRINDDNVFVPEDPSKSSNAERGQTNYLYIRVTNNGQRDARNVVVSARITPYVGLQFVYPQDWTAIDANHVSPTPVTATFATIPAGTSQIAKFTISSAQVEDLWGWISGMNWHPCLLAVVQSDNDYAFGTANLGGNDLIVRRNNLAQRNLSVIDVLAGATAAFPFIAGNRHNGERIMEIVVDRSRLRKGMDLLLALDEENKAFPRVDFEKTSEDGQGENAIIYRDRTKIEITMGCCRGVLTIEKGSRFDCFRPARLTNVSVKGGEVVIRNDKRYVDIKDDVAFIRMEKTPGQIYPLQLQTRIPREAKSGDIFTINVAQRNEKGETVGGATASYYVNGNPAG